MPLSLRYDPKYLDADLVDAEDDGALTEAIYALGTDARVDDALVPPGKENRGCWSDVFERPRAELGSKLWLLDDQLPTVDVAERLDQYAKEALRPILLEGRITALETEAIIDGAHLDLITRLTLPTGAVASLGPIRVS